MAEDKIPLELPHEEAEALCRLIKNINYEFIAHACRREADFASNRHIEDVAWSAIRMLARQLMEAGICQAD